MWKSLLNQTPKTVKHLLLNVPKTVTEVGHIFNHITGYHQVQDRKDRVLKKDSILLDYREAVKKAKIHYERTIEDRRKCQAELNGLLQRKDTWVEGDINRFAELYRRDLNLEQEEVVAKTSFSSASDTYEVAQMDYLNEIRERYVEEQLYSDRIRQASTFWTIFLMSTHLILFVISQYLLYRRKDDLKRDLIASMDQLLLQHQQPLYQAIKSPIVVPEKPATEITVPNDTIPDNSHDVMMGEKPESSLLLPASVGLVAGVILSHLLKIAG